MVLGFIIIRHVNNTLSDCYWKECYTCIRKFYNNQIIIIDDSSNPEYLVEDITLDNCTVIYDKTHKGVAELLPYYYFHTLKPFDTAVILHDSVFIQRYINFELNHLPVQFLWTITKLYDGDLVPLIANLCSNLPHFNELMNLFCQPDNWVGSMGVMSVIKWDFLNRINETHDLFNNIMPKISGRNSRSALERIIGLLTSYHSKTVTPSMFGDIHEYIRWGISFEEYKTNAFPHPIIKVWTGR